MEWVETDGREPGLVRLLNYRASPRRFVFFTFLVVYAAVACMLFYFWINPTLRGNLDAHIAADSERYLSYADCLREGCASPYVFTALAPFPNTLWAPVLISFAIQNTVLLAVFNVIVFCYSVYLLRRSSPMMQTDLFTVLLLANATTMISLLSVNKEIIDLLVIALFCYARAKRRMIPLIICLTIALLNRYEVCLMLILYMALESRFNALRRRRGWTLVAVALLLTILLPTLGMQGLAARFVEVQDIGHSGALMFLDNLELHFLFIVALIPKLIEVMFGEILSFPSRWSNFSFQEAANTYIPLMNNLANVLVVAVLLWKRMLNLASPWIYMAGVCSVVICASLVNQPRYFYVCFVLLCVQAAQPRPSQSFHDVIPQRG